MKGFANKFGSEGRYIVRGLESPIVSAASGTLRYS